MTGAPVTVPFGLMTCLALRSSFSQALSPSPETMRKFLGFWV